MKRLLTTLAVTLLSTGPAQADFVDAEVGARGQGMGGAFVAMTGDPASLFWNPAAILSERRVQVEGMRTRLFDGIEGLTEDYLGATFRVRDNLGLGLGWTRTGLTDIYHEDVITAGLATTLLDGKVQVGASVLFYGAAAPGYEALNDPSYLGAQWEPSASVGAIWRAREDWTFGFSAENLLRPEIALLSSTTDVDQIGGRRRVGFAYLLQDVVYLVGEIRHHDFPPHVDDPWTLHVGAESWFQEVLALRLGVDEGDLTAGFGLLVDRVRVDASLLTHERLGNSYRAAATVGF